jgi:hypothetical protein
MKRHKWTACFAIALLSATLWAQESGYKADRVLFERVCTSCHDCGWFLWPRTFKGWELTVERMRTRAYEATGYSEDETEDGKGFTEDESERIVNFLTDFVGEGVLLDAIDEPDAPDVVEPVVAKVVEPTTRVATEPVVTAALSAPAGASKPHVGMPPPVRFMKRLWNPSILALVGARATGFLAVACLLGLLASGFKRRTLAIRFRKVHVALALGLFVTLAIHGTVYIFEYGTPHVLWYWFGLIGFGAVVITQLQGIVRKRFNKGLLVSHITGACVGLALSILHWVWAWL